MYFGVTSRPDILHSVSKLSQRNCDPHEEYIQAVKRIFRYLRGTVNLKYEAHLKLIEGFVDTDWGGDAIDRKSYTGFV